MTLPPFLPAAVWAARRHALLTVDVRHYLDGRSGRAAYEAGHLPGATFVDLDRVLAGPPTPEAGRHPLPDPEVFAAGLAAAGVREDVPVVAYDDEGGVMAARLVWLLRVTGRDAAVLDGGLAAGLAAAGAGGAAGTGGTTGAGGAGGAAGAGGAGEGAGAGGAPAAAESDAAGAGGLEPGPPAGPPGDLRPVPWPVERLAAADDLGAADVLVLDARDAERFRGEVEPLDPRAGHVPGARSLPARSLVPDGHLLPQDELLRRFAGVGVAPGSSVIAYCGSGVTACHDLLAMEHVGLGAGRLYPGSWSQ